ncbi:Octicosapeptide/Phox/Bem1p family protein [Raphanus sativus]|uniref:Uncharacterized protein LOC108833096 n=1 Tax=Raphanus sativus TaxID=3726 RepID=A0A6J0LP40_RAPSA|nr:uncharacterized protein LOC108833096 [Raphanus sativus]KAJ4909966.1 Octicosapeptide/Phox/Bem1p family protein [Raphanus sativus]
MSVGERSPRTKVKFMTSFGGKILPRPSDGLLKYVGGETRVIAVSPDITFAELTKKLTEITENDVVLKYQILPEDLDALVSVKSDEDLKHMMDEYNRHEKLRTFLFPANPLVLENQLGPIESSPQTIEQRYIEAVNGILRKSPSLRAAPIKTRPTFTLSACSSPRSESSPDGYGLEMPETGSYQLSRLYPMHKVQSSPIITLAHSYHHHSSYLQSPNYLTCRLRPPPSPPLVSQRGWDPPHNSGGGNGKCGCNEERRFLGRTGSVPQSAMNHVLRL